MVYRTGLRLAAFVLALGSALAACSAEDGDGGAPGGSSGSSGSGTGGSGTGGWGVGGSAAGGWGDASQAGDAGSTSGGAGGGAGSGGAAQGGSAGTGGGPSCGELATQKGWAQANCEWNGNGACNGQGVPTYDCDFCCDASGGTGGSGGAGGSGGTGGSGGATSGFGYPVGDKTSSPAGGWSVWQVLGHYWSAYGGRHLAQDISLPGGTAAIGAPVYSVADGVVLYAKPNSSSYKNVLLIEHAVGDGTKVCSFYGHINPPSVVAGQSVQRGQQVATVKNWAECVAGGAPSNTHLHYVLLSEALCNKAKDSGSGSGICGYDTGGPTSLGRTDTANEPYYYTSVNDACGSHTVQNGFISPTKFINAHHF